VIAEQKNVAFMLQFLSRIQFAPWRTPSRA
jgi:hypothetical protein